MSTSTRKRNTNNVVDNNDAPGKKSLDDEQTEFKSDQMNNTSENDSDKIKTKDVSCSSSSCWGQLALCARSDSPLAVLRPLMIAMEISCHGLMWIIGSLTTLLCTHKIHHAQIVFNLLFGLIMDLIIVGLLKSVVRRQRPILNDMDMIATVPMDQYSFPSGHATRATFLTLFFADRVFASNSKPVLIIAIWSVLVCVSRLLLGRHHLSDVVMGCIIGTVEYYCLLSLWLSEETCTTVLEPIFGQFL